MMSCPGSTPAWAKTVICGPSGAAACTGWEVPKRRRRHTRADTETARATPPTLLRQQRQEGPQLDLGLGQLGGGVGAGDQAGAGVEVGLAVAQEGAAQGD